MDDQTAVLILDHAPQHTQDALEVLRKERIEVIFSDMTHVFQPADQFVIAGLKALVSVAWDTYVEKTFQELECEEAVAEIICDNKPKIREQMFTFLADALGRLPDSAVLRSWDATGICRAVWGDVPKGSSNCRSKGYSIFG
eukprot:TRINITY_DN15943_c0_g1_i2.p1 TRINITY_DN15943_c0_g1~~TRINITY_DN15943_c0_g1_i2.p1  ORF type:complete len:141 (-),score=19.75 TRINITY_DN15943_c0_g1_i2:448-870(-)